MSRRTRSHLVSGLLVCLCALPIWGASPSSSHAQDVTTICAIQGEGGASPMIDAQVSVEGVVTADFVETAADGFYLQAPACDDDDATSDGIWVFDGNRDVEVEEGQTVIVNGRVDEYFDLTEIILDSMEVVSTTLRTIEPVMLEIPQDQEAAMAYLEARESMLVDPGAQRIIGATNAYGDAYGVPLDADLQRIHRDQVEPRRLGYFAPKLWFAAHHGSEVEGLVGALTYSYENYKVAVRDIEGVTGNDLTKEAPEFEASSPDEITLATYNLENYFDMVDDPGKNDSEWTPETPEEYAYAVETRARSIRKYLNSPDIVSVEEVETLGALQDLANHEELAGANYGAVLIEGDDLRGIDVGILYKTDKLRLISAESGQACTEMDVPEPEIECTQGDGSPGWKLFSRPPLVTRFQVLESGERITVIGNHFKSKRGGDDVTIPIRARMANHLLDLVEELRSQEPEVPVVILGDLNSFVDEEAIEVLTNTRGDYVNPWIEGENAVPEDQRYSFVFNGVSQILDYILLPADLEAATFAPLPINVDFAQDFPQPELRFGSPRVSDHDPLTLRVPLSALPVVEPPSLIFLPSLFNELPDAGGGGPEPEPTPTREVPGPEPTGVRPSPEPSPEPTRAPGGAPPASPLRIDELFFDGEVPRVESDEYIAFTNVGGGTLALDGWTVVSVRGPQIYNFPDDFAMDAGQSCRVYTDEDHAEHCGLNWNHSSTAVWRNAGDKAEIRNADGDVVDWFCYGDYAGECGG